MVYGALVVRGFCLVAKVHSLVWLVRCLMYWYFSDDFCCIGFSSV